MNVALLTAFCVAHIIGSNPTPQDITVTRKLYAFKVCARNVEQCSGLRGFPCYSWADMGSHQVIVRIKTDPWY